MQTNHLSKSKKVAIILLSVFGFIIIALAVAIGIFSSLNSDGADSGYANKILLWLMPESITYDVEDDGNLMTFYVREDEDYDVQAAEEDGTDAPFRRYDFYYYDEDGNEVVLDKNCLYTKSDGKTTSISLGFIITALENIANALVIAKKVLIALVVVFCFVALILWYKSWCRREDEAKERKYKMQNNQKKKK